MASERRARGVAEELLAERRLSHELASLDFATVFAAAAERRPPPTGGPCSVCRGVFGPVLDVVELVRGQTFLTAHTVVDGVLELRQFASTLHRDDADQVPPMDAIAHFEALARAEQFLLGNGEERYPDSGAGRRGFVTISKRRSPRRHGFQSLKLRASEPPWIAREREFARAHGGGRPSFLETRNPPELLLGEFRGGVAALVPERPRRAFETILYFRPSARGLLSDLTGNQRWGLAQALREVTGALVLELAVRRLPECYSWRLVAAPDLESYVELAAARDVAVDDGPRDWVERLQQHIGVE